MQNICKTMIVLEHGVNVKDNNVPCICMQNICKTMIVLEHGVNVKDNNVTCICMQNLIPLNNYNYFCVQYRSRSGCTKHETDL